MNHRILLVEDEEHLLDAIKLNLELEGYAVTAVTDGRKALDEVDRKRFDLIILDVMLPEINGFQVCERLRLQNKIMPILFLSAKSSSVDRVQGLKLGADDYLAKPFNLEELLLRVKILVRRSDNHEKNKSEMGLYVFGENEINFLKFEILGVNGLKYQISQREIMLLKFLIDRKDEVVSREQILEKVWGYDVFPTTRTIDNYILAFRKYFEKDPKNPQHFISVRGVGYKFSGIVNRQ